MWNEKPKPELIATVGDSFTDVKVEIYKENNEYTDRTNFKIISNRMPKLELEFSFSQTNIDSLSFALKERGTFSQAPSDEQIAIRERLKDAVGNSNIEKLDHILSCLRSRIKREKENEDRYKQVLREKSDLEYKEKRIKDLIKNSGEIIEGTDLTNLNTEEIIKRLLHERRRAQMALAGVYDADRP